MKIEMGKQYQTRSGLKVRIYAVEASGTFPVHGASLNSEGCWVCNSWQENGSIYAGSDQNLLDLIPVPERFESQALD